MTISIAGLDKAAVLQALHQDSKAQGMGFLHFDKNGLTIDQCRECLEQDCYVDYLQGRVIKTDFTGDSLDQWGYDRDNGEGCMAKVVDRLRK